MKSTKEWWEFFPSNLSLFWYNETVLQEYFPLNKEEILNQGFNYSDYISPFPNVEKIILANKLPDNISKIPDDILNWAIKCNETWKPFRIIKEELDFYRENNLSVPKKHPDTRYYNRMKWRNSRFIYNVKCFSCNKEIKTTYDKNTVKNNKIYCKDCYI